MIRPVNSKRRARLYERNFGDKADMIRLEPCCVCGDTRGCDPAHVDARGMGGCKGDKSCLVPLCRACHHLFDVVAVTVAKFKELTGVDLVEQAEVHERKWQESLAA